MIRGTIQPYAEMFYVDIPALGLELQATSLADAIGLVDFWLSHTIGAGVARAELVKHNRTHDLDPHHLILFSHWDDVALLEAARVGRGSRP